MKQQTNLYRFTLICLTCLCQEIPGLCQQLSFPADRLSVLDAYAKSNPRSMESDIQPLADYLMAKAENEAEKGRLVFSWMAFNVRYDARSYN